jgi:acid phosphatase type 7
MRRHAVWIIGSLIALVACSSPAPPPSPPSPPAQPGPTSSAPATSAPATSVGPSPSDPILVGAGDIANGGTGDSATAALLARIPGTVFTAGDNAYDNGTPTEFTRYYAPTWGRFTARTRPSPGNHDYGTAGAAGYFDYFGAAAGPDRRGYYSYDLGRWHIVALNSNIDMSAGSAQERWLRADLKAHAAACTFAYWHAPLFTSGSTHPPTTATRPLFQALYDFNAEIVVSGHNHQYERFAPQTPAGKRDDRRGIREFVAGMGGASHYTFGPTQPNSQARNSDTYGVLKFTLHADGYDWQFVPVAGGTYTDSGSGRCH